MKSWYQDSLSYQLLRAARLHRTRAASMLAEIGLHPGQETVIQLLSIKDGQTMSALADAMGVQPPTVTKMIARMGSEGLVRRQASPTDGRKVFVHLTEDGQNCARKLKSLWKTLDQDAARGLGAKDRKQLTDLLQSMAAAWMPDPVDASGKPEKPTKPKKNAKAKKAKKAKA